MANYSERVRQTASLLLSMLDKALTNLEDHHKTGSPYWKRLRIRKRLVQTILDAAGEEDWNKRREELLDEFFQSSDRDLLQKIGEDTYFPKSKPKKESSNS